MLFPTKEQEGSGRGAWDQQPGGICYTFAGSPETAEEISGRRSSRKVGGGCMRGKKPRERKRYVIRMGDGTLVEVNREIYLEWYRSERRERYQKERDRKYRVCSLDELQERGCFHEKYVCVGDMTQESALGNIFRERLRSALVYLPEKDAQLVWLLFFEEMTVKEAGEVIGCSRKTIAKHRERILGELRQKIWYV